MLDRIQIPITLLEDETPSNWMLIREHDGLTKQSPEIMWLEWNEDGTFKEKHDGPDVGRSLLMSPFNRYFTWQTTIITGVLEENGKNIKFKTENSIYHLKYIGDE